MSNETDEVNINDIVLSMKGDDDPLHFLKNGFFINLPERRDRYNNVMTQFHYLNIPSLKMERINAIKYRVGALGCFLSHIYCLTEAKKRGYDHILICEDDIDFTNIDLFKQQLRNTIHKVKDWDVILLTGNLLQVQEIPNIDCCLRVIKSTAATGYIVKSHYYDTLMKNFKEGITYLMNKPKYKHLYAIDVYWHFLQKKDNWIIPIPLTVTQLIGYSNIENKLVDYNNILLKPIFKKK